MTLKQWYILLIVIPSCVGIGRWMYVDKLRNGTNAYVASRSHIEAQLELCYLTHQPKLITPPTNVKEAEENIRRLKQSFVDKDKCLTSYSTSLDSLYKVTDYNIIEYSESYQYLEYLKMNDYPKYKKLIRR